MTERDDLREQLERVAGQFAKVSDNPRPWLSWLIYLLHQLESQAMSTHPMYREIYEDMLSALRDEIKNRLDTGGW